MIRTTFEILKGKIISKIKVIEVYTNKDNSIICDPIEHPSDAIIFITEDNKIFKLFYEQDGYASCAIADISGDIEDLIDSPILIVEAVTNKNENPPDIKVPKYQESFTWTFYKISTIKGSVTICWYGESNGYYNEEVTFAEF